MYRILHIPTAKYIGYPGLRIDTYNTFKTVKEAKGFLAQNKWACVITLSSVVSDEYVWIATGVSPYTLDYVKFNVNHFEIVEVEDV